MRFCSLGSGSRGNAHIIEKGDTTVLIDCGFGLRSLKKRLQEKHISITEISAVIITHEHSDHVMGLSALLADYAIPCYMTAGTARALDYTVSNWHCLSSGQMVTIKELSFTPVAVPHDVLEPVQLVVEEGGDRRMAIFTDLGSVTPAVIRACMDVDVMMIECNYDEKTLNQGTYPPRIKRRIAGEYGHLSNTAAAQLIAMTESVRRKKVIAAHISENNNHQNDVSEALTKVIPESKQIIANQTQGVNWITI